MLRTLARDQLTGCMARDLISNSRELSDGSLRALLHSLVAVVHAHLPSEEKGGGSAGRGQDDAMDEGLGLLMGGGLDSEPAIQHLRRQVYLTPLSSACLPFAEVLITEIVLRNRDRMTTMWPLLAGHYKLRLQHARAMTFSVEKAATGLLRLAARVLSREGMAQPLAEALSWLLPPHAQQPVTRALVPHIGAGVLRIVTAHAVALSTLPPSAWRPIFELLKVCAPEPGDGAAKAFEALCLLLHEPQLKVHFNCTLTVPTLCPQLLAPRNTQLTSYHQCIPKSIS